MKEIKSNPVLSIFDEITKVPRPSKHEEKIVSWLLKWAETRGVEAKRDAVGNVLMTVPATAGKESKEPTILQAHVDMVCEKRDGVQHDFMTDAIRYKIDGDWMRSEGTTLGADDGIGVASALAVVEEGRAGRLSHGPLYLLFTIDEETGLTGAYALGSDFLPAKRLINLDSEDDGEIFIGCAGGCTTTATLKVGREAAGAGKLGVCITLKGLHGGHSGGDIHIGYANAVQLMARFANIAEEKCGLRVSTFDAGGLHNAIAREAKLVGVVPAEAREMLRVELNVFAAEVESEYRGVEDVIDFDVETLLDTPVETVLTAESQAALIGGLLACPHGVLANSHEIENLVQTSTNLASVRTEGETVRIVTSQRSMIASGHKWAKASVTSALKLMGAKVESSEGYPAWQPKPESALLKEACKAYKEQTGDEAKVKAIHAGLECGLFLEKNPSLDMISVGPTLRAVHTPDESLYLPSLERFWNFLKAIL